MTIVVVFLTMPSWRADAVTIGLLILLAYGLVVFFVAGGVALSRSREIEPTEWMRRGGLMESPSRGAHPNEGRIRAVLSTVPGDMPVGARDEVEAYLAMPDDDEKQLRRDLMIRAFYENAGSSKIDYAHRKAYNELRLALSPWAEEDPDA